MALTHDSYSGPTFNTLNLVADGVTTVMLESSGATANEWISLIEVSGYIGWTAVLVLEYALIERKLTLAFVRTLQLQGLKLRTPCHLIVVVGLVWIDVIAADSHDTHQLRRLSICRGQLKPLSSFFLWSRKQLGDCI